MMERQPSSLPTRANYDRIADCAWFRQAFTPTRKQLRDQNRRLFNRPNYSTRDAFRHQVRAAAKQVGVRHLPVSNMRKAELTGTHKLLVALTKPNGGVQPRVAKRRQGLVIRMGTEAS